MSTNTDAWSKEAWHKAIDDADTQFDALAGCMRLLYQQGFELAVIELQNIMGAKFAEGVNTMQRQQDLLKKILKMHGDKLKDEVKELDEAIAKLKESVPK